MIKIDFTTKPKYVAHKYVVDEHGNKRLYDENGDLHSYGGMPAIMYKNGTNVWYKHGKKHGNNGLPAVIYPSGKKSWWENGVHVKSEY